MKQIILILVISSVSYLAKAQNMNSNHWCITSITNLIDTNGKSYTLVDIYNQDTVLNFPDMISIGGLLSNADTISAGFVNWMNWVSIKTDTTVTLRIDTAIAQNLITGLLIQRGQSGCGMFIIDSASINKMCEGGMTLGINEEVETKLIVYPNPANTILMVDAKQKGYIKNIVLRNSLGQTVFERDYDKTQTEKIDIHQFAKGIYLLSVNNIYLEKIKIE